MYYLEKREETDACSCKNWMRSACVGDAAYDYEGNKYCIMHFPSITKSEKFQEIIIQKRQKEDYNFLGVWFPAELNFSDYTFETHARFAHSVFNGVVYFSRCSFLTVDFSHAQFREEALFNKSNFYVSANFSNSTFSSAANFDNCDFISIRKEAVNRDFQDISNAIKAKFDGVEFKGNVTFDKAKFLDKADFRSAVFESPVRFFQTIIQNSELLFGFASFKNQVRFANVIFGSNGSLRFFSSIFEKPEQVFFYKMNLEPHYFINVDVRKFNFDDVNFPVLNSEKRVDVEINRIREKVKTDTPHELLSITCRRLAANSEENNRYEEASDFRYMAMESRRLKEYQGSKIWSLHWWYWLTSLYGESWLRAVAVLGGILLIFSIIYTLTAFQVCPMDKPIMFSIQQNLCEARTLNIGEAILHSLATATFQNIEYQKPVTLAGEIIKFFERIFAPLQAALLALAIRRKFMR